MEVKLIPSLRKPNHLEIWAGETLIKTVDNSLFKKKIREITNSSNIHEKLEILEKKIALNYVIFLLSRRAYSSHELKNKMKERLISTASQQYVLSQVSPYLDDEKLLESIVRVEKSKGKGERAIVRKVATRLGLSLQEASRIVESGYCFQDQVDNAITLLKKKPLLQKEKALRFLVGRGYSYSAASQAVRNRHALDSEEME